MNTTHGRLCSMSVRIDSLGQMVSAPQDVSIKLERDCDFNGVCFWYGTAGTQRFLCVDQAFLKINTCTYIKKKHLVNIQKARQMVPQGFENAWNTYVGSTGGGGSFTSGQSSNGSSTSLNSYFTIRLQNGRNIQGLGGRDHQRSEINSSTYMSTWVQYNTWLKDRVNLPSSPDLGGKMRNQSRI